MIIRGFFKCVCVGEGGVREKKSMGSSFFQVWWKRGSQVFFSLNVSWISDENLFLILLSTKVKTNLASPEHFHQTIKEI